MNVPVPLLFTALMIAATNHLCARPWNDHSLCLVPLGRPLASRERGWARALMGVNGGLLLVAVVWLCFRPWPGPGWLAAGLPLLATAGLIALMMWASGLRQAPPPGAYELSASTPPGVLTYVSPLLQVLHAVLWLACCGFFLALRHTLPASVPVHWNGMGQPDGYAAPGALLSFGGIMLFDWLLSLGIAYGVAKEPWTLPPEAETHPRYIALQLRRRSLTTRMAEGITLGANGGLAMMWLGIVIGSARGEPSLTNGIVMASLVVLGLGILVPLAVLLGPATRVRDALAALAGSDVLGTDPSGWRLGGLVYFAPSDRALFIPKRIGIGQTLNFGRPAAWLCLALVVGAPLAIVWLTSSLR